MALWNRSSYLLIARILPIVLILSAGFFWKYEKHVRLQAEKRLKVVSDRLIQSQDDLVAARREANTATEEKRLLIQQLGDRDEHIRRLLAEMIKLLSGSGSVDLGEVMVRTQNPGAWDGVHNELRQIVSPAQNLSAMSSMSSGSAAGAGLGQVQIEERAMVNASHGAAIVSAPHHNPAATPSHNPLSTSILTVNGEHRFVVISQGSQNGLKEGMLFNAFAKNQKIGRLQVGTAYDRIATASIIDGETALFREGDSIRLEPVSA